MKKGKRKEMKKNNEFFSFFMRMIISQFSFFMFLNEFFTFFFLAENRSIYRLIGKTKIAQVSSQTGM
jgi:hypothetical protein